MQILAISDSIANTRFDVRRKALTLKAYKAAPILAVPEFVTPEGSEKTDISECLDYCFTECPPDAIALGLVRDPDAIRLIADKLANNKHNAVVSEISLISDEGEVLVSTDVYNAVMQHLMPQIQFLSINIYEAELLSQISCKEDNDIVKAAQIISSKYNKIVFVTGSARTGWKELLYMGTSAIWLSEEDTCREYQNDKCLLIAIACELASDKPIIEAVKDARLYNTDHKKKDVKVKNEVAVAPKAEVVTKAPAATPAMYRQPTISFTAKAAQRRAEQARQAEEAKKKSEEAKKADEAKAEPAPVQNLVSPAKSLRDIARNIEGSENAADASHAVTTGIEEPVSGPKGTVSEIKEREVRSSADSISELKAMLQRMKNLSEM